MVTEIAGEHKVRKSEGLTRGIAVTFLLLALVVLVLPLNSAQASVGLGVSPVSIEIEDALHGETYERTMQIHYSADAEGEIDLSASGDVSEWVTFYDWEDSQTPVESIMATPGEVTRVMVRFVIPEDAPVGTTTGTLHAKTRAGEGEGVQVSLQGQTDVSITVTGVAVLSGSASNLNAEDTEVGYPLRISMSFENTGNTVATPQWNVQILRGGSVIDSFTNADITVKRGRSEVITIEWDTEGQEVGNYSAQVAISLGGEIIAEEELLFTILSRGTLTREGIMLSLDIEGDPEMGSLIKVLARFKNTGEIDTKAKFLGEVHLDGKLTGTVESEELLIPVGEDDYLISYLELDKSGEYSVEGYINFEGKKTRSREVVFQVEDAVIPTTTPDPTSEEVNDEGDECSPSAKMGHLVDIR